MRVFITALIGLLVAACSMRAAAGEYQLFARTNLMAWCIVPFDAKKRGPEERAAMMEKLGFKHFAYDYRAEHIPQFDAEIAACRKHGVSLDAWWFPGAMNDEAKLILEVLKRNNVRAQLWVTGGGAPTKNAEEQRARVEAEAKRIRSIAEAAAPIGCTVGLYNHGAWFGEPENQIQIIERLRRDGVTNVGIIYNQHHGHDHVDRFAALLQAMKPHLVALNLNGMIRNGDKLGRKILPLGQGEIDLELLAVIRNSGWRGPIGILNHTDEDAEGRLLDNLDGLDWLLAQQPGHPVGAKPVPRTWRAAGGAGVPPATVRQASGLSPAFGLSLADGQLVEGRPEYRTRPITIECFAKLNSKDGFNILVASDAKNSSEHWELYSYAGSGVFAVYQPGRGGEFKSAVNICDGQWHHLAAVLEPQRVRLYVDARLALDKPATPLTGVPVPGGLAFGQLVEGSIGCDGVVDEVRLSRGVREISSVPAAPFAQDVQTIGLWHFDGLPADKRAGTNSPYWTVEDAAARARLPLYQTIPAAKPEELTPANGLPRRETYRNWHRSHGDNGGTRFSALDQINRGNVKQLEVMWTYRSKDGSNNIQCNPIIVDGVMFAPTPGKHIAAVNAETGAELWRFKPEGRPAFRGLVYWPGRNGAAPRIFFPSGKHLYALDPKTGRPVAGFGEGGRTLLPGGAQGDFGAATAGPTVFENIVVLPGFEKDVWGFDAVSGKLLWTFHTVPHPGEFGHDTWDRTETYGANCWAGMAMDEARGIAYISTGGPKPNFIGVSHLGDNLFANCVVAIDARTGKYLWHFQEIRHDLWDLDISAPPNLGTITRGGRRIDVVATTTKIGNTLLLDRVTGKPIFPFRLRRAPTSMLPGERTAPYQPDVELPEPFLRMEFTEADLGGRNEDMEEWGRSRFASATKGFFVPCSEGRANLFFGIDGGAEWTGACIDPDTGRLYVTANHVGWIISAMRDDEPPDNLSAPKTRGREVYEQACMSCHGPTRLGISTCPPLRGLRHRLDAVAVKKQVREGKNAMPGVPDMPEADLDALVDYLLLKDGFVKPRTSQPERPAYTVSGYPKFYDPDGFPLNKPPWGTLNCIDLNTGRKLWTVPLGFDPRLKDSDLKNTGTENYGGAIVTAGGLVFCAGTRDNLIRAFDKDTGTELWSAPLPFTGNAPSASYEVNGRQFIVIAATGGNKLGTPYGDAYVAFALPAKPQP
jgi:glucose dehydrogenase/sugar phosphate isomerase/epimerase